MRRLSGVPARRVWAQVPDLDRINILYTVGSILRAIGDTPISGADGDAHALLGHLRTLTGRHQADGFSDPEDFLKRNLPDPLPSPALIHFDLNDENVMLARRKPGWQVSGVLDFAASRAFYPPMDLVTPAVFLCRGDPSLLRALLDGAGESSLQANELTAWHLLHPFSNLPRDFAMAGLGVGRPAEICLSAFWRQTP
jgi:aminoglycoside phosphotransferase (APT) family kinase protein